MGGDAWPFVFCPSSISPFSTRTHSIQAEPCDQHLCMCTRCLTHYVSLCPDQRHQINCGHSKVSLVYLCLCTWCTIHRLSLLFLPPRGSGKPLALYVESALLSHPLGSLLCSTPSSHGSQFPMPVKLVAFLTLHRCLGGCISGPCTCPPTSSKGKPCLACHCTYMICARNIQASRRYLVNERVSLICTLRTLRFCGERCLSVFLALSLFFYQACYPNLHLPSVFNLSNSFFGGDTLWVLGSLWQLVAACRLPICLSQDRSPFSPERA